VPSRQRGAGRRQTHASESEMVSEAQAAAVAAHPSDSGSTGLAQEQGAYVCAFGLHGYSLALEVAYVGEVIRIQDWIEVPLCNTAIVGLCNIRGTNLAIVDLAQVLRLPESEGGAEAEKALLNAAPGGFLALVLQGDGPLAVARIDQVNIVCPWLRTRFRASEGLHQAPTKGMLELDMVRPGFSAHLLDGERLLDRLEALGFRQESVTAGASR
jgi:chemotaxis signal transduction protein